MTRYRNLYMCIKMWEEHFLRQIINIIITVSWLVSSIDFQQCDAIDLVS